MRVINLFVGLIIVLIMTHQSQSQIVAPTGISTRASSQLVFYYDVTRDVENYIHVTNTNDTEGVWVHVQIFRSYDIDGDDPTPPVLCDERDFIDFFTPNDTHVYAFHSAGFTKNIGESEGQGGEQTSIDLRVPDTSKGFAIITPVVSESDLTAVSFQYLIGTSSVAFFNGFMNPPNFKFNAMGRDAVDFASGEIVQDGTPLDGTTNGLLVLQPEELLFSFQELQQGLGADVIGFSFIDNYGSPGLLGYNVIPGENTWTSFIFDFKEDPTSCGNRVVNCFLTLGLNDTIPPNNTEFSETDVLCGDSESFEQPGLNTLTGWTRIFVSGLEDFENHIGVFYSQTSTGIDYMYVKGERTEIEPPLSMEDCSMEGDEDEDSFADCLDTDCATDESCETGEEECADGMDNDEDGQTDCADLGCDGFAGCEFGEEMSCDDGIDNDADGAVDGDDSDCMVTDTGGDGDGGGCVVTGSVSTPTSAVNFLILMLPFIWVFGIRRIRKSLDLGA